MVLSHPFVKTTTLAATVFLSDSKQTGGPPPVLGAIVLAAILISLSWLFYHEVISWFPSHIHAWTQSDRLALALGFVDNGYNFFLPQTYNMFTKGGVTGVDFPIHEYVIALVMGLTGSRDPVVFRMYTLIYSLIGYMFLYAASFRLCKRVFHAMIVVLAAFTFPIVVYYQAGFIPSATSLASIYIAYYFLIRNIERPSPKAFALAIGFFTLAALPRLSVNVVLFAVLLLSMYRWYLARKVVRYEAIIFAIAYSVVLAAFAYKTYLNAEYGSRFLTKLMPPGDASDLLYIIEESWRRWRLQLLSVYHWLLLAVAMLALLAAVRKKALVQIDRQLITLATLITLGAGTFFLLLARQFVAHEYYFMDVLYPALVLFIMVGVSKIKIESYLDRMFWPALLLALIIGGTVESIAVQTEKYAVTQWDRGEVTRKNFTGSNELLDALKVPENALILVYEAYSTNAPLLLMDRKGYTCIDATEANIREMIAFDYDYVVIQDIYFMSDVVYNAPWLPSCLDRVGGNGKVSVYQRSEGGCDFENDYSDRAAALLGLGTPLAIYSGEIGREDSTGRISNLEHPVTSEVEFGPTLGLHADSLKQATHVEVEVSFADLEGMKYPYSMEFVCAVQSVEGANKHYTSTTFKMKEGRRSNISHLFPVRDINPADVLKCYVWNRYRAETGITEITFRLYRQD